MVKSSTPERQADRSPAADDQRLDRQLAFLLAAVTLGLLLRDVVRDLLPGDAGEFHFAAWNWGLAHPTGYPLYLLAGGLWQHFWSLFGVSPAASLNALSAVFTAAAGGLFFLLLRRWLPGPPLAARLAAALGVAFLVANPTLRTQSVQAEVYSLHLLFLVAILLTATHLVTHRPTPWIPHPAPSGPHPAPSPAPTTNRPLLILALLLGLALTHHATTLLLLPPLALYLFLANPTWWRPLRAWRWALLALLLPLLLYLYIPLRSGPAASPWYHQPLGGGTLALYTGGWEAFWNFASGRSISVGYYGPAAALAQLPTAAVLWLRHFEWPGLLLLALGLFVLFRLRHWPLLALTLSYFMLQQTFNLFYAIGDIFVYYIPLYLIACIWIAHGAAGIGAAFRFAAPIPTAPLPAAPTPAPTTPTSPDRAPTAPPDRAPTAPPSALPALQFLGTLLLLLLFWLPLALWRTYTPLIEQLHAESAAARAMWEEILAAAPPPHAILISNDRNEIVPLFYLQTVERRGEGHTGLFPLIAPDPRFADVGATIQTALDAGPAASPPQAVYLIKPMEGLATRFALQPQTPPLVQVNGPAAAAPPTTTVDLPYGPLRLLGYDLGAENPATPQGAPPFSAPPFSAPPSTPLTATVTLHWQVAAPLAADYTTTVQLFDAAGSKLAQSDQRPGGDFYPTSLWLPGATLLDRHTLALPPNAIPARLLVGMYSGPDAALLAPPLELPLALPLELPPP